MAQEVYCDIQCEEVAAFVITNRENGDTLGMCLKHVGEWCLSFMEALYGEAPDPATVTPTDLDAVAPLADTPGPVPELDPVELPPFPPDAVGAVCATCGHDFTAGEHPAGDHAPVVELARINEDGEVYTSPWPPVVESEPAGEVSAGETPAVAGPVVMDASETVDAGKPWDE